MIKEKTFFDINQLPQDEGLLVFGISMNRIANAQSPEESMKYLKSLSSKIVSTRGIGATFVYADYLYLYSDEKASVLRSRFSNLMMQHKNGMLKSLEKHFTVRAFEFLSFGQLLLDASQEFDTYRQEIWKRYEDDAYFRKCVADDCVIAGKGEDANAKNFIVEEILAFYLISKGVIRLRNGFTQGRERWILHCYPGKPLKSEAYLYQSGLFGLENPQNRYENCYYDLSGKVLYDFSKMDIESFDFSPA